ncbi:MAG TPA: NUDIX hydrolase [Thermoanaerobaculia bacterium]
MPKQIAAGERVVILDDRGWEYVERKKGKEAVAVVAVVDGKLILTEQFRVPVHRRVIDWPAGLVGDEEGATDPATTAKKELEEETGYVCDSVELLAKGPTSPGITSEQVSFYRAHNARREGEGGGVGGEDITVHLVPLAEAEAWLRARGEDVLVDLKVWGGLYFVKS